MQQARLTRLTLAVLFVVVLAILVPAAAVVADGTGGGPYPEGGTDDGVSSVQPFPLGPELTASAQALLLIY